MFMLALTITLEVIIKSYRINKTSVTRLYVETNIDSLFNIIEKELKYTGSMSDIIRMVKTKSNDPELLDSDSGAKIDTESDEIEFQYALAEKIILKKHKDSDYSTTPEITEASKTYFALFQSEFPEIEANGIQCMFYSHAHDAATIINLKADEIISKPINNNGTILSAKVISKNPNITPFASEEIYMSPLLHNDNFKKCGLKIDGKDWYGENIYKTTIESSGTSIIMHKYIPTINATYSSLVVDNILTMDVTSTKNDNAFKIILEYKITPDSSEKFRKERIFFF